MWKDSWEKTNKRKEKCSQLLRWPCGKLLKLGLCTCTSPGAGGRAVAACSKMVPEGSFHIRLLEFKVKSYALLKFTILIYQRFPGQVMIIRSLLGHGYLWNVTGMEMGSTQREQKWPQARTGWGFQSWASARDHPPPQALSCIHSLHAFN